MNILCLDIGSGTQDVLYYFPDREIENCPKFILPSPALNLARRIEKLTQQKKNIYLYGQNMGGGFKFALKKHLQAGLKVAVEKNSYFALGDDLEKVKALGVDMVEKAPLGYVPVFLTDFAYDFWQAFLKVVDLEYPDLILAAVQDHGFFPNYSNRKGRFELWMKFLKAGGNIYDLLYQTPPKEFTRLKALKDAVGSGLVADTGAVALLGALFVPEVEKKQEKEPICLVNVGNSHILAFLLFQNKVLGIYEHHTGLLTPEKFWKQLTSFSWGELSNEEVFADEGHGCVHLGERIKNPPVYVLGPKRSLLASFPVEFLAPGGDMMLAGCFGLLKAYFKKREELS